MISTFDFTEKQVSCWLEKQLQTYSVRLSNDIQKWKVAKDLSMILAEETYNGCILDIIDRII